MAAADHSWRKRLKHAFSLHLRQIPCLHAVVGSLRCFKRSRYRSLGQDGEEAEDRRQQLNFAFGKAVMKLSLICMVAVTVLCLVRSGQEADLDPRATSTEEYEALRFKEDSPLVLYLASVEMLICGSCAATAAAMYSRGGHQLRHPSEAEGSDELYAKVELCKEPGLEEQLYGLGFRPSSDGRECLVVEDIRRDSLLERWNRSRDLSPEELVEQALGEAGNGEDAPNSRPTVVLGSMIVAVNDVYADVGLMQQQLLCSKQQVTLWVQREASDGHPSEFDGVFGGPPSGEPAQPGPGPGPATLGASGSPGSPGPASAGAGAGAAPVASAPVASAPRLACVAMEDEEAQILMRWTVCGIMFGWVTLLPILLMQPHEERPRQQLFRQFLLKPCLFLLPVWLLFWFLDCLQLLFMFQIVHPFYYFLCCHTIIPAVLVWYLFAMQATDERLVLDQRSSRSAEGHAALVVEDPAPVLLKELITLNPVAMLGLGTCASIPIVLCSLFTVFYTRRAKHAQGFVNLIYGLLTVFQLASLYLLYHLRFAQLPEVPTSSDRKQEEYVVTQNGISSAAKTGKLLAFWMKRSCLSFASQMYLAAFYFLVSIPCFALWCVCLACANHFAKKDLQLCETQRLERAKEKVLALGAAAASALGAGPPEAHAPLVDCTEAFSREYELIYTV